MELHEEVLRECAGRVRGENSFVAMGRGCRREQLLSAGLFGAVAAGSLLASAWPPTAAVVEMDQREASSTQWKSLLEV